MKPWTADTIFQTTYFCNVNRENDRVTKFIRQTYNPFVRDPMFEVNIGFSRIINEPGTLKSIGYIHDSGEFGRVGDQLIELQRSGVRTFGDAYIVSTNGRQMPKALYVAQVLLPALYEALGAPANQRRALLPASCTAWYEAYMRVFGISSFMAGQNIADLKNTPGHPLYDAYDRNHWSCPGPGSLRGLSWIFHGDDSHPVKQTYQGDIAKVNVMLRQRGCTQEYDMQDLQNCLCEFDKYMRITYGTGRSKRRYPGV
jgi:5-hmdU DNA kinase-like protein